MKVLEQLNDNEFPFSWVNLDHLPDSNGEKKEIYMKDTSNMVEELISMFSTLFNGILSDIIVYNSSWGDFCLDTWDFKANLSDYNLEGKSIETREYLKLLQESGIPVDYTGSCICKNWNPFLTIILNCLISHRAPYSPLFYNKKYNFFFYFHYSGSIGFYYRENNKKISEILKIALNEFEMK